MMLLFLHDDHHDGRDLDDGESPQTSVICSIVGCMQQVLHHNVMLSMKIQKAVAIGQMQHQKKKKTMTTRK